MPEDETPLPRVRDEDFTEQDGVNRVATVANSARLVWRPTSQRDVGIDGQIEHVDDFGRATGAMVFIQIKSGCSYFKDATPSHVTFTPSQKHANYWRRAPFPVILVLHDEHAKRTVWIDARDALRRARPTIRIPLDNIFDADGLRRALGPTPDSPLSAGAIAVDMLNRACRDSGTEIDFLDFFVHGLVEAFEEIYFGMDLVGGVLAAKAQAAGRPTFNIGEAHYEFIYEYVRYLLHQDLARVSYDDFNRVWEDRGLVGRFLAPLTPRGAALARYLAKAEPVSSSRIHAIQDKAFGGIPDFEPAGRLQPVEDLKATLTSTIESQ